MRFVIGVGGESASDSSFAMNVLDGRPVVGMRDLAPDGLSATSGEISPLEQADVLARFQRSGDDAVAMLGGYRALGFVSALAGEDGVTSVLIFEDAVAHIVRRLSAGADLSDAARDWVRVSARILKIADDCRGRVRLFNGADIQNAPDAFSYYCEDELGIRLEVEVLDAPLLDRLIAAHFVAAHHEIREMEAELLVRCAGFGAPVADALETSATALERLRSLYESERRTEEVQKQNALMKEQLILAQYKAEAYYRQARALEGADAGEKARLASELEYAQHQIAALKNSASWKVSAPLRIVSRAIRRVINFKALISERRQVAMLKKSGLFDAKWYFENYPDIAKLRVDPVRHYLRYGAKEGRSPSAKFNSSDYLKSHPDVAAAGVNPLIHYLKYGQGEARAA